MMSSYRFLKFSASKPVLMLSSFQAFFLFLFFFRCSSFSKDSFPFQLLSSPCKIRIETGEAVINVEMAVCI